MSPWDRYAAPLGVRVRPSSRQVWLAPGILLAAWIVAWIDPDTGIRKWMGLRADLVAAETRIAVLSADVERQADEALRLEADPLAIEAAIREDLGLARPGDTVVILPAPAEKGLRPTP